MIRVGEFSIAKKGEFSFAVDRNSLGVCIRCRVFFLLVKSDAISTKAISEEPSISCA